MGSRTPSVVVVAGNPRPGSRTLGAAERVGQAVAALVGGQLSEPVDLATFAGEILTAEHPTADEARARLAAADVAVVATPVHKASFTGLLKAFLDLYGPDGLAGVVVVPVVVAGSPAHALVGEVHLRPVLVELGAVVPTRSLVLTEQDLGALDDAVAAWIARGGDALRRAVGVAADDTVPAQADALVGATR